MNKQQQPVIRNGTSTSGAINRLQKTHNRKRWLNRVLAGTALVVSLTHVDAQSLIGYNVNNEMNWSTATSTDPLIASSFTTGTSPVTFNSISLWVKGDGTVAQTVSIYSDVADVSVGGGQRPSSLLFSGSGIIPQNNTTFEQMESDFTPSTLDANTLYWVVINGPVTGELTDAAAQSGQLVSTITADGTPHNRVVGFTGSAWQSLSSASYLPYIISNVSAVPEPSSCTLLAGAAMMAFAWRRRRS